MYRTRFEVHRSSDLSTIVSGMQLVRGEKGGIETVDTLLAVKEALAWSELIGSNKECVTHIDDVL